MNKQLFAQLKANKTFDEFRNEVILNIDKSILGYKAGTKTDKSIASDMKGFEKARDVVISTLNSLENIGELENKSKETYK